jgi:hypothetical protein
LKIGATYQLTPKITPTNATDKAVTWTTTNAAAATVTSSGLVTAKAAGTALVRATNADGQRDTCTVTINAPVTVTAPVATPAPASPTAASTATSPVVSLPAVNTQCPADWLTSPDFDLFYIENHQFTLGQSTLNDVLSLGLTTNKQVSEDSEIQPNQIGTTYVFGTDKTNAFCELAVKNNTSSPIELKYCTIVEAAQNDAYNSGFRLKYIDGSLKSSQIIGLLGQPTSIKFQYDYYYQSGTRTFEFSFDDERYGGLCGYSIQDY